MCLTTGEAAPEGEEEGPGRMAIERGTRVSRRPFYFLNAEKILGKDALSVRYQVTHCSPGTIMIMILI